MEHCDVMTCSLLIKALPLDAIGIDLQAERRERVAKSAPLKNQTGSAATLKKCMVNSKEWPAF